MNKLKESLKIALLVTLLATAVYFYPVIKPLRETILGLTDCKGNATCFTSRWDAISGSINTATGAIAKAAPKIAQAAEKTSTNSSVASEETAKAAKEAANLISDADKTIQQITPVLDSLNNVINDIDKNLVTISASANELLKSGTVATLSSADVFAKLGALADTANEQLASLDLGAANKTISDLDALIASDDVKMALGSVADSAGSLSEVAKTLDLATRDYRKKVGQVKFIISQLVELSKHGIPLLGNLIK
jgi:hypothetical protein